MTRFLQVLGVVAMILSLNQAAVAGTYYVAPGGNDGSPGSEAQPWRTIQHAAVTLQAGDTVYIKAGTYAERVVPLNSGSAGNVITYAAFPGDVPIIDGAGVTLPPGQAGLFEISGLSYITVSGLRVINAGPGDNHVGILVDLSNRIVISNCSTYNTASSGIAAWTSTNIIIEGNDVELACNDGEQECITVADTDTFEIRNNHVNNSGPGSIGGEGIDAKDGSRNGKIYGNLVNHINRIGIYVDSWANHTFNIEVYGNVVHHCVGDGFALAAENGGLLENIVLYNNIAYANEYIGLTVGGWGEPGAAHPISNITLINNTVHGNGVSGWGGGILIDNAEATGVVIRNNICSQNQDFQLAAEAVGANLTVDHNLIDGTQGYPGAVNGDNAQIGDPLFVDASTADYHIRLGSPAIDNGSAVNAPNADFGGLPRPQGSGYDIGAFEFGNLIFADGFESGNTAAWSAAVP
ncbi:MAG: right-handed parallel beta-helix repeat-containing protein [Thermoanaerobaculales bacterium]